MSDDHIAFFYRARDEYVDGVRSFLAPALAAGDAAAAAVPPERLPLLREAFAGEPVELLDMAQLGANPGRIIPAVEVLLERCQGRRLHYVGEPIWAGRGPDEVCEATRHEALINLAWAQAPIRVMCPYDAARLDAGVLADAERTHPRLLRGDAERLSAAYAGPDFPVGCDEPLPAAPPGATALRFARDDLERVRAAVTEQSRRAGLPRGRASDLLIAVSEVAANSIRHGSGEGVLRMWRANGRLTCEVSDRGHIADPLAGRRLPGQDAPNGRGLWLVHQLCDLVELRTGGTGTTVRMHAAAG